MKTLSDNLRQKLEGRKVSPLIPLLDVYDDEKDIAKCYSAFAYLCCAGAGGSQELAETMANVVEGFYMATSVHDDASDTNDEQVKRQRAKLSHNTYVVLGDCFFVQIAAALARAAPLIPGANRSVTIARFEKYMLDTAESQIADVSSRGLIPTPDEAVAQMKLRGGTWGRLSMEVPALAGGLHEDEAAELGNAGESLFLGLTVRDDLRDLRDDIQNGVLTLAPALFLVGRQGNAPGFQKLDETGQVGTFIDLLNSDGAIAKSLARGRDYTMRALSQLREFLRDREGMNWFLLQMIFRLTNKRLQEFTPDHVLKGQLGIGFSALHEILEAVEG